MRAVESDCAKSARKAEDKLHNGCERASEICERTLQGSNKTMHVHGKHERVTRR